MWKCETRMEKCVSLVALGLLVCGCHHVTWREEAPNDELTATEISPHDLGLSSAGLMSAPVDVSSNMTFATGLAVVRNGAAMDNTSGKR